MVIMQGATKDTVKKKLEEDLEGDIRLIMFTQEIECQFCTETREMVEELAQMSPRVSVEIYDFMKDDKLARNYGVKKIPAIVVLGKKDYGIRFFGVPSGYEFTSFIETLITVSKGRTDLSEDVKKQLAEIKKKVHIQVLVTPTCPYCALAVQTANKLAIENDNIISDMVEIVEFPEIAQKYYAMSVPKIVINEVVDFVGARPAEFFLGEIKRALQSDNHIYI